MQRVRQSFSLHTVWKHVGRFDATEVVMFFLCMRFVYPSHDCRHSDPPTACILIDVYVFLSSPKLGTEPCCVNTLGSKRAWAASSALCSDPWLCATLVVRLVDPGNIIQIQSPQQCRMIFLAMIDGHVDKKTERCAETAACTSAWWPLQH